MRLFLSLFQAQLDVFWHIMSRRDAERRQGKSEGEKRKYRKIRSGLDRRKREAKRGEKQGRDEKRKRGDKIVVTYYHVRVQSPSGEKGAARERHEKWRIENVEPRWGGKPRQDEARQEKVERQVR